MIEAKVVEVIGNLLKVAPERIVPEASFTRDLGADSLTMVELVLAFEQEFGITVPDDEVSGIVTVADAIEYAKKHA